MHIEITDQYNFLEQNRFYSELENYKLKAGDCKINDLCSRRNAAGSTRSSTVGGDIPAQSSADEETKKRTSG